MLCSQADVEQMNSVDFTNEPEAIVTAWITAVSKAVERWCGRPLMYNASKVDKFTGLGNHKLYLDLYPVIAITSVTESDVVLGPTAYELEAETGVLRRVDDGVPRGWGYNGKLNNIEVAYEGGYDEAGDPDIPADLRMAVALAVGDIFKAGVIWNAGSGAKSVTLEHVGSIEYGDSIALRALGMNPVVVGLLSDFKRYGVGVGGALV